MGDVVAALLGALTAFGANIAIAFAKTHYGDNPWDVNAFANAVRIAPHVYRALGLINGSINDMYRSPQVNAKVPGSATNSYHQLGLAVDIHPGVPWRDVESAFRYIVERVKLGELGPVRTVIWEPSWVHIDWFKVDEGRRAANYLKKVGTVYTHVEGL
jgi:Peptidase M15